MEVPPHYRVSLHYNHPILNFNRVRRRQGLQKVRIGNPYRPITDHQLILKNQLTRNKLTESNLTCKALFLKYLQLVAVMIIAIDKGKNRLIRIMLQMG